jgi:secreted trypsin-like serine protease
MRERSIYWSAWCGALLLIPGIGSAAEGSARSLQEVLQTKSPLTAEQFKSVSESLPVDSAVMKGSWPLRLKLAEAQPLLAFQPDRRIVGGTVAAPGDARWQVALVAAKLPIAAGQFCGGSVIDPNWVLTAAHCVEATAPGSVRVFAGTRDLDGEGVVVNVAEIKVHTQWNTNTMQNDVALLKLSTPLTLAAGKIEKVALAESAPSGGGLVFVTGWGATSEGGSGSARLRKVVVPVVKFDDCNAADFYNNSVKQGMMCAGVGGKDSCQGDSGGPLTNRVRPGNAVQYGIVSWGEGCAQPNKPGVYTDVATYREWIMGAMQ